MRRLWSFLSFLGLFGVVFLAALGTVWAHTRGGNDFSVFYHAWHLVLTGQGDLIYRVSPDRFLYSPAFAWLLAPLGLLSRGAALSVWCIAKVLVLGFIVRLLSKPWKYSSTPIAWGVAAWGVVLLAKPLLIDFSYGQVNLFILGACAWGLYGHFEKGMSRFQGTVSWIFLTFAAIAKLYPLPLLLVPWAVQKGVSKNKLRDERLGIGIAIAVCLLLPVVSQGFYGTWNLFLSWHDAVLAKGLPLESHNQSFTALLFHYLSGNPTAVLAEGSRPLLFGQALLTQHQIVLLSLFWTTTTVGFILGWLLVGEMYSYVTWAPVLIGLLIVPSHLIWKPYFVVSIPLSVCILHQAVDSLTRKEGFFRYLLILLFFVGVNFTGFDFIGHEWAAHVEAASFLLILHLGLMVSVIRTQSMGRNKKRATLEASP